MSVFTVSNMGGTPNWVQADRFTTPFSGEQAVPESEGLFLSHFSVTLLSSQHTESQRRQHPESQPNGPNFQFFIVESTHSENQRPNFQTWLSTLTDSERPVTDFSVLVEGPLFSSVVSILTRKGLFQFFRVTPKDPFFSSVESIHRNTWRFF